MTRELGSFGAMPAAEILNGDTLANWNCVLLLNVTRECSQSVRFLYKAWLESAELGCQPQA
jgi:hypothetical protein